MPDGLTRIYKPLHDNQQFARDRVGSVDLNTKLPRELLGRCAVLIKKLQGINKKKKSKIVVGVWITGKNQRYLHIKVHNNDDWELYVNPQLTKATGKRGPSRQWSKGTPRKDRH